VFIVRTHENPNALAIYLQQTLRYLSSILETFSSHYNYTLHSAEELNSPFK